MTREIKVDGVICNVDKTEIYSNKAITHEDNIVTLFSDNVKQSFHIGKQEPSKKVNVISVGFIGLNPVIHLTENGVNMLKYLILNHGGYELSHVYEVTSFDTIVHSNGSIVTRAKDKKNYYMLFIVNNNVEISDITRTKFEKVYKNSTVLKSFMKQNNIMLSTKSIID